MKQRCFNPNDPKYHRYGGCGIKVCDDWLNIKGFAEWALANGWREGMSIDRIDNDGNYEPSNCLWVSMSENSRKKSTTKLKPDCVRKIRELINIGLSDGEIAEKFKVCGGTVWHIRKNITHTHVK